jgi:hypothetical protein
MLFNGIKGAKLLVIAPPFIRKALNYTYSFTDFKTDFTESVEEAVFKTAYSESVKETGL